MMTGIWAEKFDHVSTVTNFISCRSLSEWHVLSVERFPDIYKLSVTSSTFSTLLTAFDMGSARQRVLNHRAYGRGGGKLGCLNILFRMFQTGYKLKA